MGLYCETAPGIVEDAGRILGVPLDTVFNLQLPEGNPDELAPPFPGTVVCPFNDCTGHQGERPYVGASLLICMTAVSLLLGHCMHR